MIPNIFGKLKSILTFRKAVRLTCVVLILVAFLLPWWRVHMKYGPLLEGAINVFPHGIYGGFPEESPFQYGRTSTEFIQLFTWIYLGCLALSSLATILKGKKGTVLLVTTGIILLTVVYMFHSRIVQVCATFGPLYLPAQGLTITSDRDIDVIITTGFQSGFYLAAIAGLLCIVSIPLEYVYSKFRHRLRLKKIEDGRRIVNRLMRNLRNL